MKKAPHHSGTQGDLFTATDEAESAREELLAQIGQAGGVGTGVFWRSVALIFIVLALMGPKIFISDAIYYKSLEISKLRSLHQTLSEENSYLRQQLEMGRYNNEIVNQM